MVLSSLTGLFPKEQLVLIFSVLRETLLPDSRGVYADYITIFLVSLCVWFFFFFLNFTVLIETLSLLSIMIIKAVPHSLSISALST